MSATRDLARATLGPLLLAAVVSGCESASPREGPPRIWPLYAYILRGDTVRYMTCDEFAWCLPPDSSHTLARWSVADSSVVAFGAGTSTLAVPSATNVLVRGTGRGRAVMTVTRPRGEIRTTEVNVTDSSAIQSLDVSGFAPDSLRVHFQATLLFQLRDSSGRLYRSVPTISVTDTSILKLTVAASHTGAHQLWVEGRSPGTATVAFTFLGFSETRQFRVVP